MATKTSSYPANCHCGAVKLTLTLPSLTEQPVVQCNCSICTKLGLRMRHCQRKDVAFVRGEQALTSYRAGAGTRLMRFCPTCATVLLFDAVEGAEEPETWIGVNVNTIVDFDPDAVSIKKFDGKDVGEPYKVPQ